jgi:hypothetical protein
MPPVASPTRCDETRFSSHSSTRIVVARGGASMPSIRSTARQYASSLKKFAR